MGNCCSGKAEEDEDKAKPKEAVATTTAPPAEEGTSAAGGPPAQKPVGTGDVKVKETKQPTNNTGTTTGTKKYSWDSQPKMDPKDYMIADVNNETVYRLPGKINGKNFVIEKVNNSNIFLFDHMDSITVDDCVSCNIFIGPVKGSVFIRDCTDCRLITASQQFRCRDCKNMVVSLHCTTKPIIETSKDISFACFCFNYEGLADQFLKSKLSIFNSEWYNIHDFTPNEDSSKMNYRFLNHRRDGNWNSSADIFMLPEEFETTEELKQLNVQQISHKSFVPVTLGLTHGDEGESLIGKECFFAIVPLAKITKPFVKAFLKTVREKETASDNTCYMIIKLKRIMLENEEDCLKIFGSEQWEKLQASCIKDEVLAFEIRQTNTNDQLVNKAPHVSSMTIPENEQIDETYSALKSEFEAALANFNNSLAAEGSPSVDAFVPDTSEGCVTASAQFWTYAMISMAV
eukprot:Nk52_evm27s628 gene=Nk52_evmTU27s628